MFKDITPRKEQERAASAQKVYEKQQSDNFTLQAIDAQSTRGRSASFNAKREIDAIDEILKDSSFKTSATMNKQNFEVTCEIARTRSITVGVDDLSI